MLSYSEPSTYDWFDDTGHRRTVLQAEGGEQGDPLMPLLFAIGIQGALEEVSGSLEDGDLLCAFLDDVYLLCEPERVRFLFDLLVCGAQASNYTKGRHECGTEVALFLTTLTRWVTRCGGRTGSKCWAPLWAAVNS